MLILGLKGFKDWYHYNGCKSIKRGNKASHDNKQSFCLSLLSLARELCFTGRRFTAQEAKEFGFVRCVLDRHFC